jgi:hypothetical protein
MPSPKKVVMTIPLSRSYEAHGETINKLELREPTGDDLFTCGMPMRMVANEATGQTEIIVSMPEMLSVLSRISDVPRGVFKQMPSHEAFKVVNAALPLFLAGPEEAGTDQSNAPSTLPGSGDATPIAFSRSA